MPVAVNVLSPQSLLSHYGEWGVLLVLFVQGAVLLGCWLPGDALLFTGGFVCAGKVAGVHLSLGLLLPAAAVGAIAGAEVGFWVGRQAGRRLRERRGSRLVRPAYLERADEFLLRFGPAKALFIVRFVPVVRTFLYGLAGTSDMKTRDFTVWNVASGLFWVVSVTLLGYYLGSVSVLKGHIDVLAVAIAVVSATPILVEVLRQRRRGPSAGVQPPAS